MKKFKIKKKHAKIIFLFIIMIIFLVLIIKINNKKTTETSEQEVIRQPVVAGTWYPGNSKELTETVRTFLQRAEDVNISGEVKAIIVPHAGYAYSGQVAAYSFKQLNKQYQTVIVLAPSHHYPLSGASILNVTHYSTPLGKIKLSGKVKELLEERQFKTIPEAHAKEHAIEIELPFLQQQLGSFELIPILVGNLDIEEFADTLMKYIDDSTLIVVSIDLSHYHPYDDAVKLDSFTLNAIQNFDQDSIARAEIDAPWAVSALLSIAKKQDWKNKIIVYANSGDVSGDKSAVVGYSSVVFYQKDLTEQDKGFLLKLARETLESYLKEGKKPKVDESKLSPSLKKVQGCFVTLNKFGSLRGCIGHILPQEELYKCVIDNAVNAALNDPRFPEVKYDELKDIDIEVSVLTVPSRLEFASGDDLLSKLVPLRDGLVLKSGFHQSTYLPQVWEQLPDKEEFLSNLCIKGGMQQDCWQSTDTEVYVYHAIVFEEEG